MMSALQSDVIVIVIVKEAGAVVARTTHTALDGKNASLTLGRYSGQQRHVLYSIDCTDMQSYCAPQTTHAQRNIRKYRQPKCRPTIIHKDID